MPSRGGFAGPRVNVHGLADLRRALKRIDTDLDRDVRIELKALGESIAQVARNRAPIGPAGDPHRGALRSSIKVSVRQKTASIYSKLPYAAVHEWGGSIRPKGTPIQIEGRHYIVSAIEDSHDLIERRLLNTLDAVVARAGFH